MVIMECQSNLFQMVLAPRLTRISTGPLNRGHNQRSCNHNNSHHREHFNDGESSTPTSLHHDSLPEGFDSLQLFSKPDVYPRLSR